MNKGKIYTNKKTKSVVMCINGIAADVDCFCGIIVKNNEKTSDSIGDYKTTFKRNDFTETIGQIELNNIHIK